MYKVYIDKGAINLDRRWKKIAAKDSEIIIFEDYSDLILKLSLNEKNIIFLSDFKSENDCYEKIRILRGKFPLSVVNIVTNAKYKTGELKRVGLNELVNPSKIKRALIVLQQSFDIADSYYNQNYVHVDDTDITIDKKNINIVSVIGASGGIGKTTIATNLAASYAEFGLKVCLVDFSLQFGDVGLFTNIKPKFTVYDLAVNNLEANPNLNLFIEHVNSNFFVLPAPVLPEQADYINRTMATRMIKVLSMAFDVIIFDTPAVINDLVLELYKLSQQLILVTTKDLNSLKNTKLQLDILTKLKLNEKVKLVINKHDDPRHDVDNNVVRKMFDLKNVALIPFDEIVVENSIKKGEPFIYSYPSEEVADSIRSLMSNVRYNCIVGEYKVEQK